MFAVNIFFPQEKKEKTRKKKKENKEEENKEDKKRLFPSFYNQVKNITKQAKNILTQLAGGFFFFFHLKFSS